MTSSDLTWLTPIITMVAGAFAYLYKRGADAEAARTVRAEEKVDALQQIINDRAAELERVAREVAVENAALRADLANLRRTLEKNGQQS